MFKFKDKTYSLEDVQLAAKDSNLSLDDYIVKVGIETDEDDSVKKNGVAETDASVTPEPNMASTLDPGSSVSTDPKTKKLFKKYSNAIVITDEEEVFFNEPIDFTPKGTSAELQPYNPETGNNLIKSEMETNYRDPVTGKVFKTNELVYRTQVDESGNLINEPFIPYMKQLSEAKEMLINPLKFGINAEPIVDPTADQVEALAEINIKNKARQDLIKSKAKTFLNDLSTEERESLIPYKVDEIIAKDSRFKAAVEEYKVVNDSYANSTSLFNLKSINSKFNNPDYKFDLEGLGDYEKVETLEQKIKDLKDPRYLPTQASVDLYNNLVNVYEQELAKLQTVKLGNGKIVPKSTFDLYQSLVKENETVINTLDSLFDEIQTLPAEIKDGKSELDFLKKEYSFSKKMLEEVQANIGIAAINAAGGSARILGDFTELVYGVKTPSLTEFSEFTEKLTETRRQQIQEKYAIEPVTFENAFDSFENMGTFIAQETVGQAGVIAMLSTGKVPGFSGIGLGGYEEQRRVLEQEEEATGIEQSTLHKAGVALGFAATEVLFGAAQTFRIFNRGFKAANEVGKRALVNTGIKNYIKSRVLTGVKDTGLESVTESLTVLSQNGIDVLRGAKSSSDMVKGVGHAAFTGGVLGVQFSTVPTVAGLALKPFSDYNTSKSVRDKIRERNELYNIGYGAKGEIGLDKRTKSFKIINEKINQLDGDIYDLVSNLEKKVSANLTPIGYELFAKATSEQEALRVEAENVLQDFDNGKISLKQKNTILKDLKINFDALQIARDQFRNDYTVNIDLIDKKEKARYLDQAKKELESEGASAKPLDIKKRAEKLWQIETFDSNIEKDNKVLKKLNKKGITSAYIVSQSKADAIKDFKEALDKRVADPNNSLTEEQAKIEIEKFTKGVNNGEINGSNFLTNNTKTGKRVYDIIVVRPNALANGKTLTGVHEIGHILFTEGISADPKAFYPMAQQVVDYLKNNNESAYRRLMQRVGSQVEQGNFDEVLTEFLEEVPRLNLEAQKNKGLLAIIAQGLNPALKNATGDVSGFNLKGDIDIIEFLKTLSNKLTTGDLTIADIKTIQESDLKVKDKSIDSVSKLSKTIVAENKRLSEQLKTATAQEAVDIKNDLALNNEGIVNDFVNSKFKSGLGITKDEFKSGVQEEVLVYLNKTYDPSKGEYGAYIREGLFGGGKFGGGRLGNILKRLGQEGDLFTKEIDDRTTPETLDLTTEEITERVEEKPTKAKESLRKKIKLDKATTKKVIDAVVKTFGTKLPPVDSPQFKKALQKAFRTELKTIIAKDVLGSRAAYETFLRDNFENIYEAIPQDIINKRFRQFAEDTGKREKTKEGKKIFKKKDITKAEFIKYFLGRDVGTSTKGTRKDALAEALAEEFAFDATMETIQKPEVIEKREFVDKAQTTEKVSKAIKRPIDLKFSKSQKQVEINEEPMKLLQALEKYERNKASMNKEELDLVEDFVAKAAIAEADKGKGAQQYTKAIKNSELNEDLKQGNWTLSDAKFKEDKKAIKEFNDQAQDLSSQVPILNNVKDKYQKVILGLFAGHYNIVGSEMAKIGSSFKQGIINNLNTKTKSVLSKETLDRWKNFKWENLETSYASKFKTALNKIYKSNNLKEQIKIAKETFNNKQGKASLELYDLWNTTMQEWLYSSEQGSKDFNKKANYILKLKKANAAIGTSGERILAPAGYVFLPGIVKEGTIKFEHLKSSSQQSFESAVLVLQGNWKKQGKQNLKAYNGIWGFLNDFNIIDDATGNVNDSNIFRFAENLELAKNIYSIKSDFTKTLYEDIVSKIGKKSVKEFEKNQKDINTFNKNILPKNIKYSKPETNQNVLNDMERLDTEAQEARIKFSKSKDLNKDFNDILERATGIGTEKRYGRAKARAVGADKGRFDLLGIPPSAQDFVGLTRYFAGKGKQGDETIAWVKENFLDPFARANIDISNARVALANDFKALKKLLGVSPKDLNKKITGEPYTVGNAVRVYTWSQQSMTIPGLSKTDQKILEDYVTADENLVTFANELIAINKDNGYPKPTDGWLAGTITTDLLSGLNTVVRAKYLKQWQNNVDEVFSETNMNKLEAAYGKGYRDALENILGRMKTGTNRGFKGDTLTGRFIDWINNSVGAIMFFNMRSAVLQTISAVNFVNWSDNNPLKAAAAFANQLQYWKDVMKLMNSDYLVERRNGLKINVSEADIAEIAAESKNKAKAFISKILKLGFLPTQIADSFAIASGGATFYRNRYKSLKKEGLSDKEAEAQAFQDFREIAEESQQSSRPDRISQQQAGPMGRIILAFANTPAQYARLMQKAASDLKNRRGDDKTNISKILYYGAIQNVIFNALQQALFAIAFGDEEPDEEKKEEKYISIANGMADSLLRGIGFHGAAISTLKNVIMKLAEGKEAQDAAIELLDISPPISSKIGKLKSAGRTWDWNKKEIMEKGWSLDNPAYLAAGQVISAATNIPLDRGIRKLQNLKDASDTENEEWMRVANALGWAKWELEWQKDKPKKKSKLKSRSSSRTKSRAKQR